MPISPISILCTNPNLFLHLCSVIDDDSDFTIQVIARSSLHGTYLGDSQLQGEFHIVTGTLLKDLIHSSAPFLRAYRKKHPVPRYSTIRKIIQGADGSIENLYSKLGWYLTWLNSSGISYCIHLLAALEELVKSVPVYYNALLRSEALWDSLLIVMRKSFTDPGMDEIRDGQRLGEEVILLTIGIILHGLKYAKDKAPDEYEAFVALLIKKDFIGVLEVVITSIVSRPDAEDMMSAISGNHFFPLSKKSSLICVGSSFLKTALRPDFSLPITLPFPPSTLSSIPPPPSNCTVSPRRCLLPKRALRHVP